MSKTITYDKTWGPWASKLSADNFYLVRGIETKVYFLVKESAMDEVAKTCVPFNNTTYTLSEFVNDAKNNIRWSSAAIATIRVLVEEETKKKKHKYRLVDRGGYLATEKVTE